MGYRGKVDERAKARLMRAEGRTLQDIADTLGVAKSSVSLWVRDMEIEVRRRVVVARRPNAQHLAKLAEIEECNRLGVERIGVLSEEAFFAAGAALYAGEGSKTTNEVKFANTDPMMVVFFCAWLRRFFAIDETRLRVRVYLHQGLDLDATEDFWSGVTRVPREQFGTAYRAVPDPSIRHAKHEHGCVYVCYSSARTIREIMGIVRALLSFDAIPG